MVITDIALSSIRDHIAIHAPERGGALFGPRGYPVVTHFEFDHDGDTTAISYVPSLRMIDSVRRVERETGLVFKGIVHSHPAGFFHPSEGDCRSAANLLRNNLHLSSIALPIVQQLQREAGCCPQDYIRWFSAEWRSGQAVRPRGLSRPVDDTLPAVEIRDEDMHVLPLRDHMDKMVSCLSGHGFDLAVRGGVQCVQIQHAQLLGLVASSAADHEFMFFVSPDYPIVAPLIIYQTYLGTFSLRFTWDGTADHDICLQEIALLLAEKWQLRSLDRQQYPVQHHVP